MTGKSDINTAGCYNHSTKSAKEKTLYEHDFNFKLQNNILEFCHSLEKNSSWNQYFANI